MLDPWIIAEIRKREEDRRREAETAVQQMPEEGPVARPDDAGTKREPPDRGVAVVNYTV